MTEYALFYFLVYCMLSIFSLLWMRKIAGIQSHSIVLDSWMGIIFALPVFCLGIVVGSFWAQDLRLQYSLGFLSLLIVSLVTRYFMKGQRLWKSSDHQNITLQTTCRFFILFFGLECFLQQFLHPPIGWDELAVWVPKMQVIATGNFSEIFSLAIPSYPPVWPIIGSLALQMDSMMLYLLPVLLLIHTLLVLAEYLGWRGGIWAQFFFILMLPSIFFFNQEIQTFTLYANFLVAVLMLVPYLVQHDSRKIKMCFSFIALTTAVLVRTDVIIAVTILAFFQSRSGMRPTWYFGPVIGYASWAIVRKVMGIPDEIAGFALQGFWEGVHGDFSLAKKIFDILTFTAKRMWWNQVYWFLPLYFGLVWIQKRFTVWSVWISFFFGYVFLQYLTVPLALGAGMDWWLGTGWVRMMSLPMLIVVAELTLLLGAEGKKLVRFMREAT